MTGVVVGARGSTTRTARATGPSPTRDLESRLLGRHSCVIGIDEVGRGALAGPVCVGVAVVTGATGPHPDGLRDSKLMAASARETMVPLVSEWVTAHAVGSASPREIDEVGIVAALRLAALRALARVTFEADAVGILDGTHNWLAADLLDPCPLTRVEVRAKADATCAVVAAASVVAKVYRDTLMTELPDPGYGFAAHKGYGAPAHIAALRTLGPSALHRKSWRLPLA